MVTALRPKILVVDDNPRNAALIEGYIKPHCDVIKANSGEECLELLKNEAIDLVILDVVLTGMNGYEVCKKIKENPVTKRIPVLLIPALPTGQEKIRSLQVGAEDFISKPFSMNEIVARVKALLKIKNLYSELDRAHESISSVAAFTVGILKDFNPITFDEKDFYKSILDMILRKRHSEREKPTHIFLGKKEGDTIKGKIFSNDIEPTDCIIPENFYAPTYVVKSYEPSEILYSNHTDEESILKYQDHFHKKMQEAVGKIINFVAFMSTPVVIMAFNYGRAVTLSDAHVIRGLFLHVPFFKSISRQIKETENAFFHTINALSKAAEAQDDNTGTHVLRLNQYSMVIAKQLELQEEFVRDIGLAAQVHDIGKIYVRPEILRKPGGLTLEEFDAVKQHPIYGARILGEHPGLKMAQKIALTHHERWDGSGYPYGLKRDIIPLEGRIVNIVDQYDALRNAKAYKPAYSHNEAVKIITEGDGRTMPEHFDPEVLHTFKKVASKLKDIYEELQG